MKYSKIQKDRILKSLKRKSVTEKNPVTALVLSRYAGFWEAGSAPQTRKIIRTLIAEGVPIGSNHKGYFILRTAEQVQVYLNALLKRQTKLAERISDTYHAFMGGDVR
jgi:hypothetical protein